MRGFGKPVHQHRPANKIYTAKERVGIAQRASLHQRSVKITLPQLPDFGKNTDAKKWVDK